MIYFLILVNIYFQYYKHAFAIKKVSMRKFFNHMLGRRNKIIYNICHHEWWHFKIKCNKKENRYKNSLHRSNSYWIINISSSRISFFNWSKHDKTGFGIVEIISRIRFPSFFFSMIPQNKHIKLCLNVYLNHCIICTNYNLWTTNIFQLYGFRSFFFIAHRVPIL